MQAYGYGASCSPTLSGHYFDGLGATPAERRTTALAKRQANAVAHANKRAAAKAKRAVKVAGKTVLTSNPAAAAKVHAAVVAAQQQLANVVNLAGVARKSRSKADIQKALLAAQSAGRTISTMIAPTAAPASAARLRGLGYMGACVDDGSGTMVDDASGQPCDPNTGLPVGGGSQSVGTQYGTPGVVGQGYPGVSPYGGLNAGITPGFGLPSLPSLNSSYGPMRACANGSNLPRCVIYAMAQDEQQQFQYVFSIMQQMYAQLLQIVQQLMAQLQSAQQQPYGAAYGQNPYGANPYADPYGGQYGGQYGPQYGGQYPGPGGYPGAPYYAGGGGDSSTIPPGYGDSGDMSAGVPGDVSQVFPGPGQNSGAGYPMQSYGGPPPGLISSDSLPSGADQQSGGYGADGGDDAAGLIPQQQSGPNLAPSSAPAVSMSTAAPTTAQPQIIVLQQGPGQSPYADSALPAGEKQNQSRLDPPEHDESGLTGWF